MTVSRRTASAQSGSDADDGDRPDVTTFDTRVNFRNHPGDFGRDPGYFVNNQKMSNLMEAGRTHCNQSGHPTTHQALSTRAVKYRPPEHRASAHQVPALAGSIPPVPLGQTPVMVRDWFDDAASAAIPAHDATLPTARRATAYNTRRAYRAGVRAWCDWCEQHALPCLPANAADVAAFLAAERGRRHSVTTLSLRRAAIRYLHFIAGCAVPTAEATVSATMAGLQRTAADAGELPARKLAATVDILRQILAPIGTDLADLRDRALLLLGFPGALRRAELAAIRVEHLEPCARGLRLTLPHSKGERRGAGVTVAIP